MNKKNVKNNTNFDVTKIFSEDFDYIPEKEERRQKWTKKKR